MESSSSPPAVPLLGTTLEDALDAGLRKAGVFCSLCGRSAKPEPEVPPLMIEYLVIDATIDPEPGKKPTVALTRFYHCGREDCDALELRANAQAIRHVPAWEVLAPAEAQPEGEDPGVESTTP